MTELGDIELLAQFARDHSEEAFAALVGRHLNLVYSVALRKVGNAHAAQEISQAVFIILSRKAKGFSRKTVLSGWLYHTTRLTAANYLRSEFRRQQREQEAYMQSTLQEFPDDPAWLQIKPLLDDAISKLGEKDRDAIVLRFFENKSLGEVGAAIGASEDAAKMRVNRALEKLRKLFSKRGVALSAAIIAGTVSAHSVQAAPVGLATTIVGGAVKSSAVTASTLALVKGALKIMAWTKMKTALVIGTAAAIVALGTTTVVVVKQMRAAATENIFAALDSAELNTAPPELVVRPTKYLNQGDYIFGGNDPEGPVMRRGAAFTEILSTAYGFGPEQMILPRNLPKGQFDLLLSLPTNSRQALREEIKRQFGVTAHPETRDTDVLVLKQTNPNAAGLQVNVTGGPYIWIESGSLKLTGYPMSSSSSTDVEDVAHRLAMFFNRPIMDETGLTNSYDIELKWDANAKNQRQAIQRALKEQLGLELFPERRSLEVLVVERKK